jgi:hypothetical protein
MVAGITVYDFASVGESCRDEALICATKALNCLDLLYRYVHVKGANLGRTREFLVEQERLRAFREHAREAAARRLPA